MSGELRALALSFRDGESYVLSEDVPNPGRDKRKKHGRGLDAQGATVWKGSRFIARVGGSRFMDRVGYGPRNNIDVTLRQSSGGGDADIRIVLASFTAGGHTVETANLCVGGDPRHQTTALAILRALRPEARSIATIEGKHQNYHRLPWRVLEALVAAGKVTVADVDAAVDALEASDNENDELAAIERTV